MRSLIGASVLAICAACADSPRDRVVVPGAPLSSAARVERQPVVVAIVVDQLSSWIAATRLAELPKDGGFAKLLREGTYVKNLRYAHAVTDTAPGHAALHSGKVPAEHGIFGNEVPDATGKRVSILRDASTREITAAGPVDRPGSSAALLRTPNVADRLRAARPDALVISVSLKDRGAILPAGKKPTWAIWFDSALDRMVTSSAFTPTFPRWATFADPAQARSAPWVPLDPAWLAAHVKTVDDAAGEGDLEGFGTTFPHVAKTPAAFRAMPASDAMLLSLARAAVDAEHDPSRPTLLLVSLSASDVVGHLFGPDSWEAWDHLRRLDASLGAFLDGLEQKVGPVTVMLAGDHGTVSMPEMPCTPRRADPWARPCAPDGERLRPDGMRDELREATSRSLGPGAWIAGVADPYVFLTPAARALDEPKRAIVDETVRAMFARHRGVAAVYDTRVLAARCPPALAAAKPAPGRALGDEDTLVLVCRSWPREGAGDYYVVTSPGSFFDAEVVPGKGTNHGTPYLYDRTVPMLVRARGQIDEGRTMEEPVDFTAFSALEAHFVGLDPRPAREILGKHIAGASR